MTYPASEIYHFEPLDERVEVFEQPFQLVQEVTIPMTREIAGMYRDAWKEAGHEGQGKIALGFHMFCHQDREEARRIAEPNLNRYLRSLAAASEKDAGWGAGASSKDYPGYEASYERRQTATFQSMVDAGTVWVGTPDDISQQIAGYRDQLDGFDIASMQVNFNQITYDEAQASATLFAREVIPNFQ